MSPLVWAVTIDSVGCVLRLVQDDHKGGEQVIERKIRKLDDEIKKLKEHLKKL